MGTNSITEEYIPPVCYNHYVTVDEKDRVIDIWSSGPCINRPIRDNDCLYNNKGSYQFRWKGDSEENPPFIDLDQETMTIISLYKYDRENNEVIRRTEEEIKGDFDALLPIKLNNAMERKIAEVSEACTKTISSGCDVQLTDGTTAHISLNVYDQINLNDAYASVTNGEKTALYHADGELFKDYSADDIKVMYDTANGFKTYHRTYINHLIHYIKSLDTIEKVNAVNYGDSLPNELNDSLIAITTKG